MKTVIFLSLLAVFQAGAMACFIKNGDHILAFIPGLGICSCVQGAIAWMAVCHERKRSL